MKPASKREIHPAEAGQTALEMATPPPGVGLERSLERLRMAMLPELPGEPLGLEFPGKASLPESTERETTED
tara:strand:+ start:437 stop:652 length:216 start_codon:yes stop_codon:yes gene_type:complete